MPPTLTANDLRRLAEAADNCENRVEHSVVFDPADGPEGSYKVVPSTDVAGRNVAAVINNTALVPRYVKIGTPSEASLSINDTPFSLRVPQNNNSLPDCAFWSDAAMRKFVVPYYTREMTTDGMDKLWKAIRDPQVVCLTHTCPSEYHEVRIEGSGLNVHLARPPQDGEKALFSFDGGAPSSVVAAVRFEDY